MEEQINNITVPKEEKFLTYKGLVSYTNKLKEKGQVYQALCDTVGNVIHETYATKEDIKVLTSYSKEEIDGKLLELESSLKDFISDTLNTFATEGKLNDIRTYPTYSDFPTKGIEDIQYIAEDTGLEYIWIVTNTETQEGEYKIINETISEEDIKSIF